MSRAVYQVESYVSKVGNALLSLEASMKPSCLKLANLTENLPRDFQQIFYRTGGRQGC